MPIEAKICFKDGLGWHKLAFPCYRFVDNKRHVPGVTSAKFRDIRIVPLYCVFDSQEVRAYIYVFPRVKVHEQSYYDDIERGLILNDQKRFTPRKVFTVDMKGCV